MNSIAQGPVIDAPERPPRRDALRLIGASGLAALAGGLISGCSTSIPADAIAAWRVDTLPRPASGADPRAWMLSHAILAPHSHNLQSWVADVRTAGEILLSCDMQRLLPVTDPWSRQIMMSHGTFLELLDLAGREIGCRCDIEMFPQGAFDDRRVDARPVARIRVIADAGVRPDPLFASITRRRTHRGRYDSQRPPPLDACHRIVEAANERVGRSGYVRTGDESAIARHRSIAKDAWRIEMQTPAAILESYRWLRIGPAEISQHRDGLVVLDPMARFATAVGLFDRTQAPKADDRQIARIIADFNTAIDSTPAFFWIVTPDNRRETQVMAGRAWVRAQLAATTQGLVMQPLSQALQEYDEQKAPYEAIHQMLGAGLAPHGQTVQMWARLGFGPDIEPAPRRGLAAHLRT